jgi:preprotein translocase subunit SecD
MSFGISRIRATEFRDVLLRCSVLLVLVWSAGEAVAESFIFEVASAAPSLDEKTNQPMVTYMLKDSARRMFADLTARNVGKRIEIRLDGQVVMSPIIREPIRGGSGILSGNLTLQQAKDIADRLSTGGKLEVEVME